MKRTLAILLAFLASGPVRAESPTRTQLSIDTGEAVHLFAVDVADEAGEHARGLMFREMLPRGTGMLFVYADPRPAAFWMKNTPIPLDMLFIGAEGRIVRIAARTEPFSLTPIRSGGPVIAILEIGGGASELLGIEEGDRVRWDPPEPGSLTRP